MNSQELQNTLYQSLNRLGKLMTNHVNLMFDIECLGLKPGCSILQIAAVPFSFAAEGYTNFDVVINRQSCIDAGLVEDPETVRWWQNQNANTVFKVFSGTVSIKDAMERLYLYCKSLNAVIHPWSNAASFDLQILRYTFDLLHIPVPWNFRDEMCFRTLKNLFPLTACEKPVKYGPNHDAYFDAMHQVSVANVIFNKLQESMPYAYSAI